MDPTIFKEKKENNDKKKISCVFKIHNFSIENIMWQKG